MATKQEVLEKLEALSNKIGNISVGGVTYLPKNTDFHTLQEAGTYCFDIDSEGTESNAPVVQDTNRHWLVEVIKSKSIYYGTCIMRAYSLNYKDEIYYSIGYINNTITGSVTWTAWKLVKLQAITQQTASSDVPVTQPGIDVEKPDAQEQQKQEQQIQEQQQTQEQQ